MSPQARLNWAVVLFADVVGIETLVDCCSYGRNLGRSLAGEFLNYTLLLRDSAYSKHLPPGNICICRTHPGTTLLTYGDKTPRISCTEFRGRSICRVNLGILPLEFRFYLGFRVHLGPLPCLPLLGLANAE